MDTLWYKNAVVYQLDVRTFQDSDGDGIGDFDGLRSRLDYLSSLGVTAVWLQPFFPTPYEDAGYDVVDYVTVDDDVGGLPSFLAFAERAKEKGIRVILDLPLNHTSDQHPWFQQARSDPNSKYRDYYIWADEPPPNSPEQIVFRGEKPDPWTYDEQAGQYYLHRFYAEEPDLNHANPDVRREILEILEFWLRLGVSGIRVDAAPYIAKKSAADPEEHSVHPFLQEMHASVTAARPDAMLMAEADVRPAELSGYFGDGREMQVLFDFLMNNYFFLALARHEAEPLVKALGVLPRRPRQGQWANWVRNHDELDLERLSSRERADVMAAFAPEDDMQIYGRGIRRRFPPMVAGDRRRMELAYSLLFALPGMPIIRYGEEIGMGEDLSLPQRNAVRTPMQWSPEANAGFSTADADALLHPVIAHGPYGYEHVNVSQQQIQRDSFLARMHLLIGVRRQTPEIGCEEPDVIQTGDPAVLGLKYSHVDEAVVVLHNLSDDARTLKLEQLEQHRFMFDVLADQGYDAADDDTWEMEIDAYGYRWFRVSSRARSQPGAAAEAATGALQDKPK